MLVAITRCASTLEARLGVESDTRTPVLIRADEVFGRRGAAAPPYVLPCHLRPAAARLHPPSTPADGLGMSPRSAAHDCVLLTCIARAGVDRRAGARRPSSPRWWSARCRRGSVRCGRSGRPATGRRWRACCGSPASDVVLVLNKKIDPMLRLLTEFGAPRQGVPVTASRV